MYSQERPILNVTTIRNILVDYILKDPQLKQIQVFLNQTVRPIGVMNNIDLVYEDSLRLNRLIDNFLVTHPAFVENTKLSNINRLTKKVRFEVEEEIEDPVLVDQLEKIIANVEVEDYPYLKEWFDALGIYCEYEEFMLQQNQANSTEDIECTLAFDYSESVIKIIQTFLKCNSVTRRSGLYKIKDFILRNNDVNYHYLTTYLDKQGFKPIFAEKLPESIEDYLYVNTSELSEAVEKYLNSSTPSIEDNTKNNWFEDFLENPWDNE